MTRNLRSKKLRAELYYAYKGKCAICSASLPDDWHADHIKPYSKGGTTNIHGMQPLCPRCNLRKGKTMLRKHQAEMDTLTKQVAAGVNISDILVSCTPGGGKSMLPAIVAKNLLIPKNWKICWVVPREALRQQGESNFSEAESIRIVGHSGEIRAAKNDHNPSRGTLGYVTTYQAISANPSLHIQEFEYSASKGVPYVFMGDEWHHVPVPDERNSDPQESAYYRAVWPLLEHAILRIYASGTLQRHDNQKIAALPYSRSAGGEWVNLNPELPWSVIQYTRKDALEEGAICPLYFRYADGAASWIDPRGDEVSVESMAEMQRKYNSAVLTVALQTEYAYTLLDDCVSDWMQHKQSDYPLSKLLIIAPNIKMARDYDRYLASIGIDCSLAVSDDGPDAQKAIDRFKKTKGRKSDVLVSVGMAYEGLDVKQITHVALMTKYRSRAWIEQAISRANRMAPGKFAGFVYAPDDPGLGAILSDIEKEQQGIVIPRFGPDIDGPGKTGCGERGFSELIPLDSEMTRYRSKGLDSDIATNWGEDEAIKQAMQENNLSGSPAQFKAAQIALGIIPITDVNGVSSVSKAPLPPLSQREKTLKKNIERYISSVAKGDVDAIKGIRFAAKSQFGPIDNLDYETLKEQWKWLNDTFPGGVDYEQA